MSSNKLEAQLGQYKGAVDSALKEIEEQNIVHRIWSKDHTVWREDPTEITNRLGWLHSPDVMKNEVDRINHLVKAVKKSGYTNVMVLGMGGSSLAPEVFSIIWSHKDDRLALDILDSTDPGAVLAYDERLDPTKTLFIVSTKSGGTAETLSFFKYFYNRTLEALGGDKEAAGQHFIGITDPGSKLEGISDTYKFRALFLNDPNIGGRYSALSFFGLIPAALAGVEIATLLDNASDIADTNNSTGAYLGAIMGELEKVGRDKITLIASPKIAPFGDWVEQLIAESTGKEGKGILPVVGEALGSPDVYADDRLFAYMRLDDTHDAAVDALKEAGHPVVTLHLDDIYDLGAQFFLWEMATAIAGYRIDIQPFDQPNVEAAKKSARKVMQEYEETGKLPTLDVALEKDGIGVIGDVSADTPQVALTNFIAKGEDGAYISIHAYVQPTPETTAALSTLQTTLRDKTKYPVTVGYGPRFLHSTGQLHKGDGGNGLFIQFTADMPNDADIPDEAGSDASAMSFGTLKDAQALGDREALLDVDRDVIRFHLSDVVTGLATLTAAL